MGGINPAALAQTKGGSLAGIAPSFPQSVRHTANGMSVKSESAPSAESSRIVLESKGEVFSSRSRPEAREEAHEKASGVVATANNYNRPCKIFNIEDRLELIRQDGSSTRTLVLDAHGTYSPIRIG